VVLQRMDGLKVESQSPTIPEILDAIQDLRQAGDEPVVYMSQATMDELVPPAAPSSSPLAAIGGVNVYLSQAVPDGKVVVVPEGMKGMVPTHSALDETKRIVADALEGYTGKGAESLNADAPMPNLHNLQSVSEIGGWQLVLADGLEHLQFYVDPAVMRTYVSRRTYEMLCCDDGEALEAFFDDMTRGGGMKRLVTDAGPYRAAALAEMEARGELIPARRDLLEELNDEANALLIQAASLNRQPTQLQTQVFSERLAKLMARVKAAEDQVAAIRGLADLAAVAVADL
jgi:hypothetical protein